MPTIVEESQQALQAGYCVVIGLQSTGEVCFTSRFTFTSLLLNILRKGQHVHAAIYFSGHLVPGDIDGWPRDLHTFVPSL